MAMMHKFVLLLSTILVWGVFTTQAQSKKQQDTLVTQGIYPKKKINALAPTKAAFYSAVLPGLGQAYNKRYWKIPVVWAAIGTGAYFYSTNNKQYNRYRDAYKRRLAGYTDDPFYDLNKDGGNTPDVSTEALLNAQKTAQRNRDLSLLITIGLYALNIIDANVDAHLQQFNVNDDLSFKPYLEQNHIDNQSTLGLSMSLQF